MTAGLFLKNDFGGIQIDETYPSIGLVESGNLTIAKINHNNWTDTGGSYEYGATVSIAGTFPLLALGGDYICGIKSTVNNGDGTWTFQVCAEKAANSQAIPYYIFDNAKLIADEGCGLIVRNAAGELTFVSTQKPMRLVDITSGALPSGWSNNVNTNKRVSTWTYTAGRVYAFSPLATAYRYYWAFGTGAFESWSEYFYGAKRIANGIQAEARMLLGLSGSNHDSQVGDFETQNYQFLVFDVTNY
jgi:hypothetical protein